MKTGKVTLENQFGETIRTLAIDEPKFVVVYRFDTRRLEVLSSTKQLDEDGVTYQVIKEAKREEIAKSALDLPGGVRLTVAKEVNLLSPNVETPEESNEKFISILKYTAVVQFALVGMILIIGWFTRPKTLPEETLVKIVAPENRDLPMDNSKAKTVEVSEKKLPKQMKERSEKTFQAKSNRKSKYAGPGSRNGRPGTGGRPGLGTGVGNAGALGVLGGMGKQFNGPGGLNIHAAKTATGTGYSGIAAAGGFERSLHGKGLFAAGIGYGNSNARGFGGYGTKGRGGGRPGYGVIKMGNGGGSSGGYFAPLGDEDQASIEGGLDRDQINAVIQRHLGQVIGCYEQGLQVDPSLSGRVSVRFVIGTRGAVNSARVADTSLKSSSVEGCIVNRLKAWQFPKPTGNVNVRVTYPFVLKRLSQG